MGREGNAHLAGSLAGCVTGGWCDKHGSQASRLNIDDGSFCFDFLNADEISLPCSGARLAGCLPCRLRGKVRFPERPRATLLRPSRIDPALSRPGVEKRTVPARVFSQRHPTSIQSGMEQPNLSDRFPQDFRNPRDLVIVDPNHPRISRAAVSTLRTAKTKSLFVPGPGCHAHDLFRKRPLHCKR